MNLKQLHTTLLLTLCAALAACSDQDVLQDPSAGSETDLGKTPIELSVGGVDAPSLTRAVISSDQGRTMQALPKGSSIYMLFMANELDGSGFKTTRTIGFAQDQDPQTTKSDISFTASNEGNVFVRYWDDAYARKSALSIAAVTTPGYGPSAAGASAVDSKAWSIGGQTSFQNIAWTVPGSGGIESSTYINWPIGNAVDATDQTSSNFITYQDLCFSNNIGDNTQYSLTDTRIKFDSETKKFGTGTLIFNHALSKLTFHIKKGEGFTDQEFLFNTGTNIKLSNFYRSGRFIIGTGEFTQTSPNAPVKGDIAKINQHTTPDTGDKFTLDALVIPGTDMTTDEDAVTFYINHNEYKLTMAQLYAAFTDAQKTNFFENGKLKAGVHYVFTFTVSKTQISGLTAQIVPWETVNADNIDATNARISLMLEERGTYKDSDVDFYRAKDPDNTSISDTYEGYNWTSGYNTDGKATETTCSDHKWKTPNWYWPDNTTFYHIRAIAPTTSSVTTDAVGGDYTTLQSGSLSSYKDVCWGAPMLDKTENEVSDDFKWTYDAKSGSPQGFGVTNSALGDKNQIFHAIGPTNSTIKLILFHMMSQVKFTINTTNGADAVDLGDGTEDAKKTTIEILDHYNNGMVLLGNGLVQTTGSKQSVLTLEKIWKADSKNFCDYAVVPQDLTGVKLRITTPDNNRYIVDLKDVKATTIGTNNIANPYALSDSKYIIDSWYPGFKYNYTFTLSKKKIESITATILDWETVTAEDEVQIK